MDSEELWIRRLLDVGRSLMTELDLGAVLDRVLETAREITGARYAALGILNEERSELEQFLTSGVDEETHRAIGALPRGQGVLGVLIENPRPLRLPDVGRHPSSYGFPAGHPVMHSFLGVPIVIRGQAWGNLYLTEKQGEEFGERDEEAATILADWAAVAIDNARVYETSERRRHELEKAFRSLEATRDVAVAIGGEVALEHVLELIVKRGRALVAARSLVIMLRDRQELVVRASAGHAREMHGVRLPIAHSSSRRVLEHRRPERITNVATRLRTASSEFGVPDAHTALLVPMVYRGEALGVLAAFDRGAEGNVFGEDDEQMLRTFAASAATAVAMAQSVQTDRLRASLAAADAERRHWARELHDETLQGLGGLRVLLSSVLRRNDPARAQEAMREAVEHIEQEIGNLRAIITELRPAALDELGLRTAIEALLDRHRQQSGFEIDGELALPGPSSGNGRLDGDLETAVYRLVQEALTNVAKHARADRVRVAIRGSDDELFIEVHDDGAGFDPETTSHGFGLSGMQERVTLAGGTLSLESDERGTLVAARLPVRRHAGAEPRAGSRARAAQPPRPA
ncbi:MAG TPA: GAF domain-containing sensor histidine kinase [Solirubrobacteraceae bacterium]|jgi:signal transduction histidine kinase|nr:GAF domain-containing sensor histidine kinase [Solirubrobacteraceae bacterium]